VWGAPGVFQKEEGAREGKKGGLFLGGGLVCA